MSSDTSRACPRCGAEVGTTFRFCSSCGHPLVDELPQSAAAPTPPRLFGVLAPGPTFVLGSLLLLGGVLTLAAGRLLAAIVLLAFAGAAFVLFYGAAERDPSSPVARRAITAGRRLRGWA